VEAHEPDDKLGLAVIATRKMAVQLDHLAGLVMMGLLALMDQVDWMENQESMLQTCHQAHQEDMDALLAQQVNQDDLDHMVVMEFEVCVVHQGKMD